MKLSKIKIVLSPDAADALPELYAVGRGADPRGRDIAAWEKAEAERVARVEARRRESEAAQTTRAAKPEAAE